MSSYILQSDNAPDKEIQRLDDLHESIKQYLGGRLSLAPLEETSPSSILELGSGSGAWAIQAARQFPDAQVTAVDMKNLPDRLLPPNLSFQTLDLTKPLPFESASFDIIHARLVMMHLPHAADIMRAVTEYLKPGGWLIIEDPDHTYMSDDGGPITSNLKAYMSAWLQSMQDRGMDPCFGGQIETILRSFGSFAEVNNHYIDMPLSGQSSVLAENQLGAGWKRTMQGVTPLIRDGLVSYGATPEIVDRALVELEDPSRKLTVRLVFTWSKKT